MRVSNHFFFVLALSILAMVLLVSAQDTAKYEACVQTDSCKKYSSSATACEVDEDTDLTTPRHLSADQILCLCLGGDFLESISSCLECVGYSSVPWQNACLPAAPGTSSSTSASTDNSDDDNMNSNIINGTNSLFGGSNDIPNAPSLGLNESWSPRNTAIILGTGFGVVAIAIICISVWQFRRRKSKETKGEPLKFEDGANHNEHEHSVVDVDVEAAYGMRQAPLEEPRVVRSDPEHGGRSHREHREHREPREGRKHRTRGESRTREGEHRTRGESRTREGEHRTRREGRPREGEHSAPRIPPDVRLHPSNSVRRSYDV